MCQARPCTGRRIDDAIRALARAVAILLIAALATLVGCSDAHRKDADRPASTEEGTTEAPETPPAEADEGAQDEGAGDDDAGDDGAARAGGDDVLLAIEPNGEWAPHANRDDLPICTPEPVELRTLRGADVFARTLRAEASGRTLVRSDATGSPRLLDDAAPEPGTQDCDDDGCWTALPAFAFAWDLKHDDPWSAPQLRESRVSYTAVALPARHDDGTVRVTVRANEMGSAAVLEVDQRFDPDGHLLAETYHFDGTLWYELAQTWRDGRLVEAVQRDHINGTGTHEYTFTYDDEGRLETAVYSAVDQDHAAVSTWRYDADGRPIEVVRTLDDAAWETHRWRWTDDGSMLVEHEAHRADVPASRGAGHPVDDHQSGARINDQRTWDLHGGHVSIDGTCWRVPTTLGHGYPAAEQVYDLGWPVGLRQPSVEHGYGAPAIYVSLQRSWYGHGGVATGYTLPAQRWDREVDAITTRYDDRGWATEETIVARGGDDPLQWTRTRTTGAHGVERDVLKGQNHTAELVFERSDTGHVVRRQAFRDGELVGEHLWERDAHGRILRHAAANVPHAHAMPDPSGGRKLDDLPASLPVHVEWMRRYGPRSVEDVDADGPTGHVIRLDALGRVVERTAGNHRSVWHWASSGDLWTRQLQVDANTGERKMVRTRQLDGEWLTERAVDRPARPNDGWRETFVYEPDADGADDQAPDGDESQNQDQR